MSSSDNSPSPKMYLLMSSEGETFEVEESVAVQSETIKHMIEVDCTDPLIPLPNVMSKILVKIIEYCKRHADAPAAVGGDPAAAEAALKAFDADFIKLDKETLFDLILAANYLNVKNLLDLACQNVADHMIKGKSTDEIRQTFNIKNDFTPEEETELRSERT